MIRHRDEKGQASSYSGKLLTTDERRTYWREKKRQSREAARAADPTYDRPAMRLRDREIE